MDLNHAPGDGLELSMSRSIPQHTGPEMGLPVQWIFEPLCNNVGEHVSKAGTLAKMSVRMEQGLSPREEDM